LDAGVARHCRSHCWWPITPTIDGWIGAVSLELTAADMQVISDAIARTGAGEGPTMPQLEHADAAQ
jgi:hypothetical protein